MLKASSLLCLFWFYLPTLEKYAVFDELPEFVCFKTCWRGFYDLIALVEEHEFCLPEGGLGCNLSKVLSGGVILLCFLEIDTVSGNLSTCC